MDRAVLLGVIIAAQGLRGEVKVKTFTAAPEALAHYGALHAKDGRVFEIAALRATKANEVVVAFKGVNSREAAEALKGVELSIARAALPAPEDGEYYHADLVGLEAVDEAGRTLGVVSAIHNFGAGDVIELVRPNDNGSGGDSVHLPFTAETVPHIDLARGILTVAIPRDDEAEKHGFVEMSWDAAILTLFPDMFPGPLDGSLIGRAREKALWSLSVHDIREHGLGKHRTVDDTPSGGGPGMVMRADVAAAAIDAVPREGRPLIYLSPRGAPLTQARVAALAAGPGAVLLCGRFEGLDERVIAARGLEEISLGDFVLAGGEIAAMALIEACVRLLPGVLGDGASAAEESFAGGLLEYPQFTRPQSFEGRDIPAVLTGGNHEEISKWRRSRAEALTRERRPDLWGHYEKPKP